MDAVETQFAPPAPAESPFPPPTPVAAETGLGYIGQTVAQLNNSKGVWDDFMEQYQGAPAETPWGPLPTNGGSPEWGSAVNAQQAGQPGQVAPAAAPAPAPAAAPQAPTPAPAAAPQSFASPDVVARMQFLERESARHLEAAQRASEYEQFFAARPDLAAQAVAYMNGQGTAPGAPPPTPEQIAAIQMQNEMRDLRFEVESTRMERALGQNYNADAVRKYARSNGIQSPSVAYRLMIGEAVERGLVEMGAGQIAAQAATVAAGPHGAAPAYQPAPAPQSYAPAAPAAPMVAPPPPVTSTVSRPGPRMGGEPGRALPTPRSWSELGHFLSLKAARDGQI